MGIARGTKWDDEWTAKLAKAFDEIGYEEEVFEFLDGRRRMGYDINDSEVEGDLESYIIDDIGAMFGQFCKKTDDIDHFFIESIDRMYVDYEQIAQAYIELYRRSRNLNTDQTSRNSKTFLKTNQKKPAPKKKPANARKPANRRK